MGRNSIFIVLLILFFTVKTTAQQKENNSANENDIESININISRELECFNERPDDARYAISLCADVPNNKKQRW